MRKFISLCLALFMISPVTSSAFERYTVNVRRVSGNDRYETALKVNQECFSTADKAILGYGNDFASSLYGAYIGSSTQIPFLLNDKHGIKGEVLNELKRLGVKKVYIMGGYNLMDKSIDNTLIASGMKVERVVSRSGYDEAARRVINRIRFGKDRPDTNYKMLINDSKFPDLISALPVLARVNRYAGYTLQSCVGERPNRNHIYQLIVGGHNSVPKAFKNPCAIKDNDPENTFCISRNDKFSGRFNGKDRYETAVKVLTGYYYMQIEEKPTNTAVIVNGEDYPDALASSLMASHHKGVTLLAKKGATTVSEELDYALGAYNLHNVIIIGGENSVTNELQENIEAHLKELKKINDEFQ